MTEKELKKLSRLQLLELLVLQGEENENLKKRVKELENEQALKTDQIANLGSVAEAAVQISGVLDAAQLTADTYMQSAKKRAMLIIKKANEKADEIVSNAEEIAKRIYLNEADGEDYRKTAQDDEE